jgi:predicted GIY-YIG superfamily endonuclease
MSIFRKKRMTLEINLKRLSRDIKLNLINYNMNLEIVKIVERKN